VYRALTIAIAVASLLPAGCHGTMWDAVTSRRFRDEPFKTVGHVMVPEDPMVVLRADPPRTGDEIAKALHRLKEPIRNKGTQEDQDQIIELLSRAATSDNSPVMRYAAISALGRFEDPRATGILVTAYQKADGPKVLPQGPSPGSVVQIGGTSAGRSPTKVGIGQWDVRTGPTGFAPDTVAALRCGCLEGLGHAGSAEAAQFLAAVAGAGGPDVAPLGSDDPEVQQAAVRGLARCRQPDAVVALAYVLNDQASKPLTEQSLAMSRSAHQGLVRLTGKKLPANPEKWNEVVQAGVTLAPEPNWVENAIQNAAFWDKNK
jgi:hypothetical protein